MANRKASVWKYVKIGRAWRYCRPVVGKNGKIKPDYVHVNSHEEHHPEGHYYVHYTRNGKQVWEKRGKDPADAVEGVKFMEGYMTAVNLGIKVEGHEPPLMIAYTMPLYLEEYRLANRPRSHALMKQTLEEFSGFVHKNVISQITRLDMLKYKQWLIDKGRSDRTASNKMLRVNQYLRAVQKLEPGKGLVTEKDGKYTEKEPEIYTDEELEKFFANCDDFQTAVFKTYLMSGLRRKELENLTWNCVDLKAGTLKVEAKSGFSPKTWEERTVEIPTELVAILKALPRNSNYVFPTRTGGHYTHSWDDCVKIAATAEIDNAFVHKFRATYATRLLQGGVDLKTVQRLCGWKSLESAMRYFAKAQSKKVRAKVDAIWKASRKRRSQPKRNRNNGRESHVRQHALASKATAGS